MIAPSGPTRLVVLGGQRLRFTRSQSYRDAEYEDSADTENRIDVQEAGGAPMLPAPSPRGRISMQSACSTAMQTGCIW